MEPGSPTVRVRALLTTAAVVLVVLAVSPVASAQTPGSRACWRAVVTDWANGGIDQRHSVRCYRTALHNLPNDLRTYTTAEDDIRRAILDEIRTLRGTTPAAAATRATRSQDTTTTANTSEPTRVLQGRSGSAGGVPTATTTADTAPPLRAFVAAGLALLLVLVAGIGKYLRRRDAGPESPA